MYWEPHRDYLVALCKHFAIIYTFSSHFCRNTYMYFTRTSKLLFFIQLIVVKLEQNNDKQINGNFRPKKHGRRVVIVTEDALWKWIAHSIHLTRWVSWISKYSFIKLFISSLIWSHFDLSYTFVMSALRLSQRLQTRVQPKVKTLHAAGRMFL